ncbi:MAG: type II secretion system protein GspL [Parvularculaceae bacterium]
MIDFVLARVADAPAEPVAWAAFDGEALAEVGRCPNLETFGDVVRSFDGAVRIGAVLRGETVAMRALASPSRSAAKFRAAATLLLEDELAEAIDDLHVAATQTSGVGRAFALKADLMDLWTAAFAAVEAPLAVLTVDFCCLGGEPERPVIFIEPGRMIASVGDRGFAADHNLGRMAVKSMIDEAEPTEIVAYGPEPWLARRDESVYAGQGPADDEALLAAARRAIDDGSAVNLLQGPYKPAKRRTIEYRRFQRAGMMAAGRGAAAMVFGAASAARDGRVAARYEAAATRLHEAAFPEAANEDPRAHARAALSRRTGASFLDLTSRLNAALNDNDNVAVDRIRYDRERGQFVFSIRSQSDADIETFRRQLAAQGVDADDSSGYRRAGAAWIGEMSARI